MMLSTLILTGNITWNSAELYADHFEGDTDHVTTQEETIYNTYELKKTIFVWCLKNIYSIVSVIICPTHGIHSVNQLFGL